jgi:hypothetical protein
MEDEDLLDMIQQNMGEEPQPASARSKAQFRFLQSIAKGGDPATPPGETGRPTPRSSLTPDDAQNMVAPPIDPWSGQPFNKYYRMLPNTAKEGPDPFEEYNQQIQEIMRNRRRGF